MKHPFAMYTDPEWAYARFEELTGAQPVTSVVREEGGEAGLLAPWLTAGVHTKVTRSYAVSMASVMGEVLPSLQLAPMFESSGSTLTGKTGWVEGRLHVGEVATKKGERESEVGRAFQIVDDEKRFIFIVKREYLASGYEDVIGLIEPLRCSFEEQARCYCRVIGFNKVLRVNLAIPYVIVEAA